MKTITFRPLRRVGKTGKIVVASYDQWRKVRTANYNEFNLVIDGGYKRFNSYERYWFGWFLYNLERSNITYKR